MIKLILTASITLILSNVRGQNFDACNEFFGKTYVFTNDVNLRSYPSLDSSILYTVPFATELREISTGGSLTIDGKVGNWRKVFYKDKVCFVWSHLIASIIIRDLDNNNILYLFGHGNEKPGKIKVIKLGRLLSEIETRFSPRNYNDFEARDVSTEGIQKLLVISRYASKCGQISSSESFAWDGHQLHYFFTESAVADGRLLNYVKLEPVYEPIEKKGMFRYISIVGELKEKKFKEGGDPYDPRNIPYIEYTKNISKLMVWNGEKLVDFIE